MNPFERYGIAHLSASSINAFTASPALFVLERVLKRRTSVGAAAHRGTAVEAGIVHGLMTDANDDDCVAVALKTFAGKAALCSDPRKEKEEKSIPDMVLRGLAEFRPYGRPSSTQGRIEHRVEGLMVPIIGFYDVEWDAHGVLLDIKTSHALPSEISTTHARQISLYRAGRGNNYDCRISYVTPKKSATYRLENADAHLAAMARIAMTIQRFLSISGDPEELVAITAPDTTSFYFNDPITRAAAYAVWQI